MPQNYKQQNTMRMIDNIVIDKFKLLQNFSRNKESKSEVVMTIWIKADRCGSKSKILRRKGEL